MAGTDHARAVETGPQPVFVLVAPQMGENIGAAARAMWNFGLDRMRLVAPRDGWPNPRAEAMASGAGRVLDRAAVAATTAEACADLTYVFATTARDRALTKLVRDPRGRRCARPARWSPPASRSASSSAPSAPASRPPTWCAPTP